MFWLLTQWKIGGVVSTWFVMWIHAIHSARFCMMVIRKLLHLIICDCVVEMQNKCKIWTKSVRMWNICALIMLCFPANCCECLWSNSVRWCGAVWSVMGGATLHRGHGGRPSVCRGWAGRDTTAICTELTLASWPGPLSPPPAPCPV